VGGWLTSLTRGRTLDVALAVGLGYGAALLAKNVADIPVVSLAQHVDDRNPDETVLGLSNLFSAGVYLLNFELGSTVIFYGDMLSSGLALGFIVILAAACTRSGP
jgi:hypothetical protein